MSNMRDRETAFENKFAHDEQLRFRAEARCCKLFGLWVAQSIGLSGDEASDYAKRVVGANLDEPGFDDVKRAVRADLDAKGIDSSDSTLDTKLAGFLEDAKRQIMTETGA